MGGTEKKPWVFDCIQRLVERQDLDDFHWSGSQEFSILIDSDVKAQWRDEISKTTIANKDKFDQWLSHVSDSSIVGFGQLPFGFGDHELTRCWYWMPCEHEQTPTFSIVSSRLGKDWTAHSEKLDALRTAVARAAADRMQILTAEDTTTDLLVRRAAVLFDVSTILIRRLKLNQKPDWYMQNTDKDPNSTVIECFVWPAQPDNCQKQSWLDSLVIENAERLLALHVRNNGTIAKLITSRLTDNATTMIFQSNDQAKSIEEFTGLGATPWLLVGQQENEPARIQTNAALSVEPKSASSIDWSQWLVHLTRANPKEWPDQSETEYLDSLLLGTQSRDCLATLMRIVCQGRLIAGNELIRGDFPMVCFSDVNPVTLYQQRTFRSHLNRWDYEPYGIAIRKRHIESIGGQPVIYGDQCTWNVMKENERPYFQKSKIETGQREIDWRSENEWRVFGDVDLNRISLDDVMVLVETDDDVEKIAPFSRWKLIALQD